MKPVFLLVAVIALISSTATAQTRPGGGYKTGNDIFAVCTGKDIPHCMGYLMGIADAMDANPINNYRACIPKGVVGGQLKDVVVEYLSRNAASRQEAALGLVAEAYQRASPVRPPRRSPPERNLFL
jgi:hypothetical protein